MAAVSLGLAFGSKEASAENRCLVGSDTNVDLAFFVVSLHHGSEDPPTNADVEGAAKLFRSRWSDPDKLVVLIPAGPTKGLQGTRADLFRDELKRRYGNYAFNYQVTGSCVGQMGALTQAIITGKDWPLRDIGCEVTKSLPGMLGAGYDTYGEFVVAHKSNEMSFRVLALQTPGDPEDGNALGSRLSFKTDMVFNRASEALYDTNEPSFVGGDFNWPGGNGYYMSNSRLADLVKRKGDWINCERPCVNQSGVTAFSATGGAAGPSQSPQKISLFQMNGRKRLDLIGFVEDEANEPVMHSGLGHRSIGALFRRKQAFADRPKTCPPKCADTENACGDKCVVFGTRQNCSGCGDTCNQTEECVGDPTSARCQPKSQTACLPSQRMCCGACRPRNQTCPCDDTLDSVLGDSAHPKVPSTPTPVVTVHEHEHASWKTTGLPLLAFLGTIAIGFFIVRKRD